MLMFYLFFIVLLICTNPRIQQHMALMLQKDMPDDMSGLILAITGALLIICIAYGMQKCSTTEPFLFEVSKNKPHCHGLYKGIPNSFQYSQIGCKQNWPVTESNPDFITVGGKSPHSCCCDDKNPSHGYIEGDDEAQIIGDGKRDMILY